MGAPYSQDLRLRVLAAVDSGMSKMVAHQTFLVSRSTIDDWLLRRRETGTVEARSCLGVSSARVLERRARFELFAAQHRHSTLKQMQSAWQEETGQRLSEQSFSVWLRQGGWTRKKRAFSTLSETPRNATSLPNS